MALGFITDETTDDSDSNGSVGTVIDLIALIKTLSAGLNSGIG